jgi:ankyrin repeat protein
MRYLVRFLVGGIWLLLLASCSVRDMELAALGMKNTNENGNGSEIRKYHENEKLVADYNRTTLSTPQHMGYSEFQLAVSKGDTVKVNALLDSGADINTGYGTNTPINLAITDNNVAMVKLLIQRGAKLDQDYESPLGRAIFHKRFEIAKLLIRKGANVNITYPGKTGATPLFAAIRENDLAMVKLVVAHGANVNIKNYDGETPLGLAKKRNNKAIVNYLKKSGAK